MCPGWLGLKGGGLTGDLTGKQAALLYWLHFFDVCTVCHTPYIEIINF